MTDEQWTELKAWMKRVEEALSKSPAPVLSYAPNYEEPETCALAAYFKAHPNETSVNLYCGCPKCSPTCSVTP